MNSQVLIGRDLLQELASFCSDSRSYNEAMRVLYATPAPIPDHLPDATKMVAPIPDAGELERLVTEQVKHAYYERKTITEAVGEIVSALQASAMVVPDNTVPVDRTMLKEVLRDLPHTNLIAGYFRRLLAASPAPGDSQ